MDIALLRAVCVHVHRKKRECQMQLLPTPFDTASIQGEISCNNLQTLNNTRDGKGVREGRTETFKIRQEMQMRGGDEDRKRKLQRNAGRPGFE